MKICLKEMFALGFGIIQLHSKMLVQYFFPTVNTKIENKRIEILNSVQYLVW